jgi:hypothetical protein
MLSEPKGKVERGQIDWLACLLAHGRRRWHFEEEEE